MISALFLKKGAQILRKKSCLIYPTPLAIWPRNGWLPESDLFVAFVLDDGLASVSDLVECGALGAQVKVAGADHHIGALAGATKSEIFQMQALQALAKAFDHAHRILTCIERPRGVQAQADALTKLIGRPGRGRARSCFSDAFSKATGHSDGAKRSGSVFPRR